MRVRPMKRSRVRRRNPERADRLRAAAFGRQAALCRTLPCAVCGQGPPSDPAHHPSRGAGGKDRDTFPACRACHREQHDVGVRTFEARHGVDLAALVRATRDRLAAAHTWAPGTYRVPRGDLPF